MVYRSLKAFGTLCKPVIQTWNGTAVNATLQKFRFLDLPSELRNHVYELLLTPEGNQVSGISRYNPCILAACKQIHQEADGLLNDVREADICILVHDRKVRNWLGFFTSCYGLSAYFKGALIFRVDPEGYSEALRWPPLLSRVRTIMIRVSVYPPDISSFYYEWTPGKLVITVAHNLYTWLSENASATALKIIISTEVGYDDELLGPALTPLCALAARIDRSAFDSINTTTLTSTYLQDTTTAYCRLFRLEEEIKVAIKIHAKISAGLPEGLQCYRDFTAPNPVQCTAVWGGDDLEDDIDLMEGEIEELTNVSTISWPKDLTDAMVLLRKMRANRKMEESWYDAA